jgi:hypothetical protein
MRDGRRDDRRPAGAVLGPLALLIAAAALGFGMWRVLMRDEPSTSLDPGERLSRHDPADLQARP